MMSWETLAPASWRYENVDHVLWVAPDDGAGASNAPLGSEDNPYHAIQDALEDATPGVAIMVKEGVYREFIDFTAPEGGRRKAISGEPDAPILLISADGAGAAKIVAPSSAARPVIKATDGQHDIGVVGFSIKARAGMDNNADAGAIKIGGDNGDFDKPAQNILIAGNEIIGAGLDGVKAFVANDVYIVGNTINGRWGQEAIDLVGVRGGAVAHNTIDKYAKYTGLTLKAGSADIEIHNNAFTLQARDAIWLGGIGDVSNLPKDYQDPSAGDIHLHDNYIAADAVVSGNGYYRVGGVVMSGAQNIQVENNVFDLNAQTPGAIARADVVVKDNPSTGGDSRGVSVAQNLLSSGKGVVVKRGQDAVVEANVPVTAEAVNAAQNATGAEAFAGALGQYIAAISAGEPLPAAPVVVETPQISPEEALAQLLEAVVAGHLSAPEASRYDEVSREEWDASEGRDRIITSGRADYVDAGDGADRIVTRGGDDKIVTGQGRDIVNAGAGDDLVVTGGGGDLISLGAGRDMLRLTADEEGAAQVKDFVSDLDTVDLAGLRAQIELRSQIAGEEISINSSNIADFFTLEVEDGDAVLLFRPDAGEAFERVAVFDDESFAGRDVQALVEDEVFLL